jgi:low temperature requirement protein LtrA
LFFDPFLALSIVGIAQAILMSASVFVGGSLLLLTVLYIIWAGISCFSCSKNVKNKIWMWITRLLMAALIVNVVYLIVIGY